MARATSSGAVVSDDGNWYWGGARWLPLTPKPPTKAPGLFSGERLSLGQIVKGRNMGEMKRAGEALAAQMVSGQSAADAAVAINPVQVKHYKDAAEFERDAAAMGAAGWTPQGELSEEGKVAVGRTLGKTVATGGLGLLLSGRSKKGGGITVTWVWRETPAADTPNVDDVPAKLRDLAGLRDEGILSESEFETKKADLLGRM